MQVLGHDDLIRENIKRWLQELKEYGDENILVMMVGNKIDLSYLRAVELEEGKSFAEENNLFFIEASAVESINVELAFTTLIKEITNTVIPQMLNQADSTEPGVWPHLPSHHERARTLSEAEKESKNTKSPCCKSN